VSCTLYWFSGTGNSRAVAASLADLTEDAEMVWMGNVREAVTPSTECVGFVFPVYCFGLPNIVRRVAHLVQPPSDAYVFSVATMAKTPGACHSQLRDILAEHDTELKAAWSIQMPSNYTPFGGPGPRESRNEMFSVAEKRTHDIADTVLDRLPGPFEDSFVPLRWLGRAMSGAMKKRLPQSDAKFHVLEECSLCGTCERVCPVGNIVLENEKPAWQHHCELCFACLQWCPVEAIQYGKNTLNRPRYHHPAYSATDFFLRPGTEPTPEELENDTF
jgi:ferredoxin